MKLQISVLLSVVSIFCACEKGANNPALQDSKEAISKEWDGTMVYNHPDNPFMQPIPDSYEVHPNSVEMIELIKEQCGENLTNTYIVGGQFGIPIYLADNSTPVRDIKMNLYKPPNVNKMLNVPIIEGSKEAEGSDKHYSVINEDDGCIYEFWLFNGRKAGSGNGISISSTGIYEDGHSTVAAGWSQLQGLIWPKELQDGVINHAISFSVPVTNANGYVSPATHNDGALTDNIYAIPEGALVRISPLLNIDTLSNITEIERTVYKAIQKYGMYCRDTNGAGLGFAGISKNALTADAFPVGYDTNNNSGNYFLKNFPFDWLEVLNHGDLTPSEPSPYIDHGCVTWQ